MAEQSYLETKKICINFAIGIKRFHRLDLTDKMDLEKLNVIQSNLLHEIIGKAPVKDFMRRSPYT